MEAGVIVLVRDDPANVRPKETEQRRRVQVIILVGEAVMMAVMGGPPEHAFLDGGHGQEGDDELEGAAGLVGTMRKITVIAGGDPEHAASEQREAGDRVRPTKRNEEDSEGQEMQQGKRPGAQERNACAIWQGYLQGS